MPQAAPTTNAAAVPVPAPEAAAAAAAQQKQEAPRPVAATPPSTNAAAGAAQAAPKPPAESPEVAAALRREVAVRREAALKAQAYRDAFEHWDLGEQRQRAGEEAFGRSNFVAVATELGAASSEYSSVTGIASAVQQARQHLAAGRLAEASASAARALARDAASAVATQLVEEIRVAVGQAESAPEKTRAEAAVSGLAGLGDAHGFAALLEALQVRLRKAQGLYVRGRFREAVEECRAVVAESERLKALEGTRQAVEALRNAAAASRQKAEGLDALREAPAQWRSARAGDDRARQAMNQGDFEAAGVQWKAAQADYEKAAGAAALMQTARQQAAARQWAEARKSVEAAIAAGDGNETAQALLDEVTAGADRDAAQPLQAAARAATTGIATLDDGQGFSEAKAAAVAARLAAEAQFARGQFRAAATGYEAVRSECERLKALDAVRQGVAPSRAQALAARKRALDGGAPVAASGLWRRAEATNAIAEAAFQGGAFDPAKAAWAAAAPAYEAAAGVAAAIASARQFLAQGNPAEAARAAESAAKGDPDGDVAKQMLSEVRIAADRASAQPVKARAEADAKALAALDDADGFDALKKEAWRQLRAAGERFDANQFTNAVARYEAVSRECARLKTLDIVRQAAAALRAQALAKRSEALAADGRAVAPGSWQEAERERGIAEQSLRQGQFEDAAKQWPVVLQRYGGAAQIAAAVAQARTQLAAGAYAEAQKALAPLPAAAASNAAVKAASESAAAGAGRQSAAPALSRAEAALEGSLALDDEQGFYAPKQSAWQRLEQADALLESNRFAQATAACDEAAAAGAALLARDGVRRQAAAARATLVAGQTAAAAAGAPGAAPQAWQQARKLQGDGDQAFEDGDFETAAKCWKSAESAYAQAGADAAADARVRSARQAWLASRGRVPAEADRVVDGAAGPKAAAIRGLVAKGDDPGAAFDARAAAYREAAAQAPALRQAVVATLLQQADAATQASRTNDAVAAATSALAVEPGNAAAQAMLDARDGPVAAGAVAPHKARAEAAVAGLAGIGDAQGFAARKASAAAELAAGHAHLAQKRPGQALGCYFRAAADAEQLRALDARRQEVLKQQAAAAASKQAAQAAVAAEAAAEWQGAELALAAAEPAFQGGDFDAAAPRYAEARDKYDAGAAIAKGLAGARALLAAKKFTEARAAARAALLQGPDNAVARRLLGEIRVAERRAAAEPIKARADSAAAEAARLEDAQGFASAKQALAQQVQAATASFSANQFEKAVRQFRRVEFECLRLKQRDAIRRAAARQREQVAAAKQRAAGAQPDAPTPHQLAEQAANAGEQAFQAGRFDVAAEKWGEAIAGLATATAAADEVRRARAKLQAKDYATALDATFAALVADPPGDAATKLAAEIRLAAGMESALPSRARAEAALKEVTALGDGQGFAAKKTEIQSLSLAAVEAWGRNAFDEAIGGYQAVTQSCARIKALDAVRTRTAAERKKVTDRRVEAQKTEADKVAPALWQQAEAMETAGAALYESGRFGEAAALWGEALAALDRAAGLAAAVRRAQALHAAGKSSEAVPILREVLVADAGSPAALQALATMDTDRRRLAAEPVRKQAAGALAAVAAVADPEGFAALKQAAQQISAAGDTHLAAGRYEDAAQEYDAVVPACEQVKSLDARRAAAQPLRAKAEAAAGAAARLPDGHGFQALKQDVARWQAAAAALYDQRRFPEAGLYHGAITNLCQALSNLELARREADGARAGLEAGVARAQAAGLSQQAPELWQRAEQARAAGQQAFERGDFDTARRRWAFCGGLLGQGDSMLALVRKAEQETAAGKLEDALATIAAAADIGFDNARVTQQQTAVRDAVRRRELGPLRRRAEQAAAEVAAIAGGQGLEPMKQQVQQKMAEAAPQFEQARFDAARAAWLDALVECGTIRQFDGRRQKTAPVRERAVAAVNAIGPLTDAHGFAAIKTVARQHQGAAENFFEQRQFDEADAAYRAALAECGRLMQAERRREAVAKVQEAVAKARLDAQGAEVPASVPERWQAIDQACNGALESFNQGAFDEAEARWQGAAEQCRVATGLGQAIRSARALHGQQKFAEAATSIEAALAIDTNCAAAKQVREEIRVSVRRDETGALRQQAEAGLNAIAGLQDAQGFDSLKNKVRDALNQANALRDQNKFDEAAVQYGAVTAECARINALNGERSEATPLLQEAKAALEKASKFEVAHYAPERWKQMESALQEADAAYGRAEFAKARDNLKALLAWCADAGPYVERMKQVYDGVSAWHRAVDSVPAAYFEQMGAFGGEEWAAIRELVRKGGEDALPPADRIAFFKKAAAALPPVAAKVEEAARNRNCREAVAEAKALLGAIPIRPAERTAEHTARATNAVAACRRALANRARDAEAAELLDLSTYLAVPLTTGACLRAMAAASAGWTLGVAFCSSGDEAITVGEDGTARVWDLWRGKVRVAGELAQGPLAAVACGADGRTAVCAGEGGGVVLWNAESASIVRAMAGHTGCVNAVAAGGEGGAVLSAGEDGTLRLWNTGSGQCVQTYRGHSGSVNGVAVTRDGKQAASGGDDRTVRLWDVAGGGCVRTHEGHTAAVTAVALSPDGRSLLSGSADGTVRVWDSAGSRPCQVLTGHVAQVQCVAFSPDATRALSGGRDGTLRLWSVADGRCLAVFAGHSGWVRSVAFSPDGLVAASVDESTLRLWFVGRPEGAAPQPGGEGG